LANCIIKRGIVLNKELLSIYLIITILFGTLAAISAFIITYREQKKNHTASRRQRIFKSFETAIYSFVVLSVLVFIAFYLLMSSL